MERDSSVVAAKRNFEVKGVDQDVWHVTCDLQLAGKTETAT